MPHKIRTEIAPTAIAVAFVPVLRTIPTFILTAVRNRKSAYPNTDIVPIIC